MKTKIKRHSRAVISVVLAISMLISCMMVGIIATDAAYDNSEAVGAVTPPKLYIGQSDTSLSYKADLSTSTAYAGTLKKGNNYLNLCKTDSTAWNNSYIWYNNGNQKPRWDVSGATGINNVSIQENNNCYYIYMNVKSEATYYFKYSGSTAEDMTLIVTGGPNPVCTSIALTTDATDNKVSSDSDTFSLNATATGAVSGDVTYKFYKNDGTQVGTTQTSSNGTATVTGLTQAGIYQQKYYVTASKSGYEEKTSDKITITNTSVSGTKTIYVGVISFILDENFDAAGTINPTGEILNSLKLHYWGTGIETADAGSPTYTGITKQHTPSEGWSGEGDKTFYMYSLSIPSAATGMKAWLDLSTDRWFGGDGDASANNTVYIYNYSGDKADYANESYTTSDLTIAAVDHATVTATYDGVIKGEGETFSDIFEGMSVTISVTPDKGYQCNGVTGTYSGGTATVTGSGNSYTLTMPGGDTTVETAIGNVSKKRIYFNNYYTRYAMVSAYATYEDGTEALGKWSGQTMTKMDNSHTWYIDVPSDVDYVTFIGDHNANTGQMEIPWYDSSNPTTTYANPKYTAPPGHNDAPTIENGGTWGNYTARTNETIVSDGTTFNTHDNLFTGISATLYDYYVDNEITSGWISGIGDRDYSKSDGSQYDWNPYRHLDHALSVYASQTWNNVWRPLYFGNLNTVNGGNTVKEDTLVSGNPEYTNWNLNANNSINLTPNTTAITGLSGNTLANSTIHYAKSDGTNGAEMAMFDEDFLSGENDKGENLAQILRVSSFPIRKETVSSKPTKVYLDTSGFDAWEGDNAVMRAVFFNSNTSEATRTLVTATKVTGQDHFYVVDIPSGYSKVQWWRVNPSNLTQAWNYGNEVAIPTDNNNVSKISGWNNSETWGTDSRTEALGSHDYYQFDSQNGTDNAYITNRSADNKTATIDYYSASDNKKVKSCGNNVGFYPFDYAQAASDPGLAKDLGFGMKLNIPFTLEKNGEFEDGTHQTFDFSGDDDLWVYVDGKLVLDLGGAHARTEGHIDFADKTITVTSTQLTEDSTATRNGSFTIDNTNTNQLHTMTIYYMERGMYDSNLMFGFSFHAVDNQLNTEKKVRTANINSGFYTMNDTTKSGVYIDGGTREVTKFEATYQNEDFIVTHEYKKPSDASYSLAAGKEYTIGSSATQTVGADGTYKLKNDEIAYFVKQFDSGDYIRLKESPDSTNLYNYDQSIVVYDDANNSQIVPGTGDATSGYEFVFTPTTTAQTTLEVLNLRARFTNQMRQHDLYIQKDTSVADSETNFTFRIKFKFGDYDYTAYPLYCIVKNAATGANISTGNLSEAGEITIKAGQIIDIPRIPENALIQVEEINIDSTYNMDSIVLTDSDSATVSSTNISNGVRFAMGDKEITALVTNSKFSGFTISKDLKYSPADSVFVDYPDSTSEFRVKVEQSTDSGSTWSALASKAFTSSDSTRTNLTTDANGITTIKRGEKLSFSDIAVNNYIRVTEDTQASTYAGGDYSTSDHMPLDYQYRGTVAVQGTEPPTNYNNQQTSGNYFKGCSFQLTAGRVDVTVTNMKPRYRWVAMFTYNSRSTELGAKKLWGDLQYQSKGVFTADELLKYTKFGMVTYNDNQTIRKGIEFKSATEKAEFLSKKSPHVDNFRETLSWNYNDARIDNIYDKNNGNELSLNVTKKANSVDPLTVYFYFPNQMMWTNNSTELVVNDSDKNMHEPGVPNANIGADGMPGDGVYAFSFSKDKTVSFADWYTTNNKSREQGAANAKFVTAPTKVWDVATNSYKYFQYWSIRTITNNSSDSVEYAKCYNKEFNYVFYQNSYVYAVYGDNNQNMYDIARQVDNSANLTFLENSRNQWNVYSSKAEESYIKGSTNYADRLFSDFVIDFHYSKEYLVQKAENGQPAVYSRKNILLNEIPDAEKDNYKAGVLIETVRALDSTEVDTVNGKMLKTDKEISEQYSASNNINAKNDAIDYLYRTLIGKEAQDKNKYLTSPLSVKSFDNKNEMEYAYSFANIKQNVEANNDSYTGYRKETDRKMKLYRAYSYLIDNSDSDNPVKIISNPVYFTIYDMASIINDYDIEVTKK